MSISKELGYILLFMRRKVINVETLDLIKKQIAENPIIIYMKGSPKAPQCGFSARAIQCLTGCGVEFAHVDILEHPEIRQV